MPPKDRLRPRDLLVLAVLLLACRLFTLSLYRHTCYYYGMVLNQFLIADAAFQGKGFAQDRRLAEAVRDDANGGKCFVPLEDFDRYPRSGSYTTFPASDVPGYGYLMAATSRLFGGGLTSRWAYGIQVAVELGAVLLLLWLGSLALGGRAAFLGGFLYIFLFPYIWPLASWPFRDMFVFGSYGLAAAAFFALSRLKGRISYAASFLLLLAAVGLLWFRPATYYYFFLAAPLALLARPLELRKRVFLAAALVLLPWGLYGKPYQAFNLRHYGTVDTDVLGRGLWEGMGILPDNPYGFKLDDGVLVEWCRARGKVVEYGSPEMNKELGDYARKVIREDPRFYLSTLAERLRQIWERPLETVNPFPLASQRAEGLSALGYLLKHPRDCFVKLTFKLSSGPLFFWGGLALAAWMVFRLKERRAELAALFLPAAYVFLSQVPLHFEQRYTATGAWVLVLAWGWGIHGLLGKIRGQAYGGWKGKKRVGSRRGLP